MVFRHAHKQPVRQSKGFDRNAHRSKLHSSVGRWNPDEVWTIDSPRARVLRLLYLVAAGAALLYIGVFVGLWYYQERVLFQPPSRVPDEPVAARRVSYSAADGVELFGYLVGECTGPGLTVVAFHGNA